MAVVYCDIYDGEDLFGDPWVTVTDEDLQSFEMRMAENDLGSGQLSIMRSHPAATYNNLKGGNYVRVRIPLIQDDPIFGFWLDVANDVILSPQEESGEVLTRGGPGQLFVLGRALFLDDLWAPAPPASAFRGNSSAPPGYWMWKHKLYGQILVRFIEEGQNEPGEPLSMVTIDFDRDVDSDGTDWPAVNQKIQYPIGTDGLTLFDSFAATGELFVTCTPDFLVQARQVRGVDRTTLAFGTGKVLFTRAVNILTEVSREVQGAKMATHALVCGADNTFVQVDANSGAGRWITVDYTESNDPDVLAKVGLEALRRRQSDEDAFEFEMKAGDDEANGLYLPLKHFRPGDTVTVITGDGEWDLAVDGVVTGFRLVLADTSDDETDELAARSLRVVVEINGSPAGMAIARPAPQIRCCIGACDRVETFPGNIGDTFTLSEDFVDGTVRVQLNEAGQDERWVAPGGFTELPPNQVDVNESRSTNADDLVEIHYVSKACFEDQGSN